MTCPICLSEFKDPCSLLCGHVLCRSCISDLVTSSSARRLPPSCPFCRSDFSTVEVSPTCIPDHLRTFLSPAIRPIYLESVTSKLEADLQASNERINSLEDEKGKHEDEKVALQDANRTLVKAMEELQAKYDESEKCGALLQKQRRGAEEKHRLLGEEKKEVEREKEELRSSREWLIQECLSAAEECKTKQALIKRNKFLIVDLERLRSDQERRSFLLDLLVVIFAICMVVAHMTGTISFKGPVLSAIVSTFIVVQIWFRIKLYGIHLQLPTWAKS